MMLRGYASFVSRWRDTDRVALTTAEGRLTYAAWASEGEAVAAGMLACGIGPGARVATVLPNGPDILVALYAVARIGATLVPVSTWARPAEIARVLDEAVPDMVLGSREIPESWLSLVEAAGDAAWRHRVVEVVRNPERELGGLAQTIGRVVTALRPLPEPFMADHGSRDLVVLYTSGSSGKPKGVRLSHRAIALNASAIVRRMGYRSGEVVYSNFPLFFSGGLCNALSGAVAVGGELVTQARFAPVGAASLIQRRRCTARIVWRDGMRPIVDEGGLPHWSLSYMKRGLALGQTLIDEHGLAGDLGVDMYGMTETATAFTCGDSKDTPASRSTTHGMPLPGNVLRLVEPGTDAQVARGEEGEICVAGPHLMEGYTDGSHVDRIDARGFFRTGDLGRLDERGHLHFTGRTSSMIKTKGLTVQPEEIERTLLQIPGVLHAVAVGLGDGVDSTGVGALVSLDATAGLGVADIEQACRRHLSSYKVPSIRILEPEAFPLTASLKVDRQRAAKLADVEYR